MAEPAEVLEVAPLRPAKPVIKWVGGKTQLLPQLRAALPEKITGTYYEAFTGGGALFFDLASSGAIKSAALNDWNPELVNLYRCVRDRRPELQTALQAFLDTRSFSEADFYEVRSLVPNLFHPVATAARTVYLNKTCFNGLYRQNKSGKFNTPWGKNKPEKVTLFNAENLAACERVLQMAQLSTGDFSVAVSSAGPGDVAYFDPPYVPVNDTANFVGYTRDGFTLDDQRRVAATCLELMGRGVHCVASNADVPVVRELYSDPRFELREVQARRNVNTKGTKRGPVGELIIVGRPGLAVNS
jgi:DNA adenine methylase